MGHQILEQMRALQQAHAQRIASRKKTTTAGGPLKVKRKFLTQHSQSISQHVPNEKSVAMTNEPFPARKVMQRLEAARKFPPPPCKIPCPKHGMVRDNKCLCCEALSRKAEADRHVATRQAIVVDLVSSSWAAHAYYNYKLSLSDQCMHNKVVEQHAMTLKKEQHFSKYLIAMDDHQRLERDNSMIMEDRFQRLEYKVQHMFGAHSHG